MSTRATYQFPMYTADSDAQITFYIHHDGYPEGAAVYFWNMHVAGSRGAMAERFFRSNDVASFTANHDSHGDTEYRYTLKNDGHLTAEVRSGHRSPSVFKPFFEGHYAEFISENDEFLKGDPEANYEPIYALSDPGEFGETRTAYYTRTEVKTHLDDACEEYDDYQEKFPQYVGNLRGYKARVDRWETLRSQLPE